VILFTFAGSIDFIHNNILPQLLQENMTTIGVG